MVWSWEELLGDNTADQQLLSVCVFAEGGQREDGRIGVFSSKRDL